jgi:hypothetical protein
MVSPVAGIFQIAPLSERHFSSRDRQICNCMMIHTITAAMMSVAITQFMTIIAHIVANTCSTDDQRRWMRRALDPGASARVAAGYRFSGRHVGGAPSAAPGSVIS